MLKTAIIRELKDWKLYIGIISGCIVSAVALGIFLAPNNVASGGVTGAAMVINNYLPSIPLGQLSIILNIPIFILCLVVLGPSFGFKSLFATVLLGIGIDFFSVYETPTHDLFLASVFGGVILGVGIGLVIRSNATTGGTDLLARIVHKLVPGFSIGQILLVIDAVILASAAYAFNSVEIGLYAAISLFITSYVIDAVVLGIDFSRAAYIVSDKSEEIAQAILVDLNRGVTGLKGRGMFSKEDKNVLICVMRKREIPKLRKLVKGIDNRAFVFLADVRDVIGEGFDPHE